MIEHSSGWMDAYYFSFSETGEIPIDVILSAVARAGKAYHHTESWSSEDCDPYEPGIHRGASCVEWIQNAAADAAAEFKSLHEENVRLKADVDYERDVKHKLRARVGVLEAEVARLREAGQRCIEISTALAAAGIVGHQNILDVMGAALAAAKGE